MHIFIDTNMITLIICSFQSSIVEILYLDTNLDTRKKFGYFLDTFGCLVRYLAIFGVTDTGHRTTWRADHDVCYDSSKGSGVSRCGQPAGTARQSVD